MDMSFYKRARGIVKPKTAGTPFNLYPRKPAQVALAAPAKQPAAGTKARQPAAATMVRSAPAPPPPSAVIAMEPSGGNTSVAPSGSDSDVDRRAALYISRVQERLQRERMVDDWRMYY